MIREDPDPQSGASTSSAMTTIQLNLAWVAGFEPALYGFGDRRRRPLDHTHVLHHNRCYESVGVLLTLDGTLRLETEPCSEQLKRLPLSPLAIGNGMALFCAAHAAQVRISCRESHVSYFCASELEYRYYNAVRN